MSGLNERLINLSSFLSHGTEGRILSLWLEPLPVLVAVPGRKDKGQASPFLINTITHPDEVQSTPVRARHFCLLQSPPDSNLVRKWDLAISSFQEIICHGCCLERSVSCNSDTSDSDTYSCPKLKSLNFCTSLSWLYEVPNIYKYFLPRFD